MFHDYKTGIGESKFALMAKKPAIPVVEGMCVKPHQYNPVEILLISSFPPRECGIANYSKDLVTAIKNKFGRSFLIRICPIENDSEKYDYQDSIEETLNTDHPESYSELAYKININPDISLVLIQHEFGFFNSTAPEFITFLKALNKPIITAFHTVLPNPNPTLKQTVQQISEFSNSVIVMTNHSAKVLKSDYGLSDQKIEIIPHGTHLVSHPDKLELKIKYKLTGKKILSTFGFLSEGKNIETTLEALPAIILKHPDVLFLIIGKTHPSVYKIQGDAYIQHLEQITSRLNLDQHVRFIHAFLPLDELLEYLQLSDIYLFTSKDPNQTVSGTFSYAISSGCPIVSTPIPHALEVLNHDAGILIDFEHPIQLSVAVNKLLDNEDLRKHISLNGLQRMASTAWENVAILHSELFCRVGRNKFVLIYNIPPTNLKHIQKITSNFGMVQFSKLNRPDISSGYTLDDNARALIAMCQHLENTGDQTDLISIKIYFDFISHCMQTESYFLNYVNEHKGFTDQNNSTNLADANGRAIWALGYMVSLGDLIPSKMLIQAEVMIDMTLRNAHKIHSTRAMAFLIKGLYYYHSKKRSDIALTVINELAGRLVQMYRHETDANWHWFESYLTYANSILPEALLCAYLATGEVVYRDVAKITFDFLVSKTFKENRLNVISNKNWLHKGEVLVQSSPGGEQPIDVAYTILALYKFYNEFRDSFYHHKMQRSFEWFLGNNHLRQIVYNPCTGGCYDGLEEHNINLNQGAESAVSYLMAKMTIDKSLAQDHELSRQLVASR